MKNNFPSNLRYLLRLKNWTQEELAEKLDVSRGSVAKWLSGENYPSLDNLRIMRELFVRNTIDEMIEEDLHVKDSTSNAPPLDQKILTALEEIKLALKKRKIERRSRAHMVGSFSTTHAHFT